MLIIHHQGATDMAEVENHYDHDAVPKQLAAQMQKDQQMEMKELQQWLLEHRK